MSSAKKVNELRQIILEDYGLELSSGQAFEVASQLTGLFEVLIYGKEVKEDDEISDQDPAQRRNLKNQGED
jgi:hypothetical protein